MGDIAFFAIITSGFFLYEKNLQRQKLFAIMAAFLWTLSVIENQKVLVIKPLYGVIIIALFLYGGYKVFT